MYVIIYSTASDEEEAYKIGKHLVEEKLVACANILPKIKSCYQWKGKVEEDSEAILFAKTLESLAERVIKRIKDLHSYEIPAILVFEIKGGNEEYLKWITEETSTS
ncbi:MAG: divalent-cation tolerance protein CutA [Asgard group archaeon]